MGRLCYPTPPNRTNNYQIFAGTYLAVGKEGMPCPGERSEVGGALFAVFALRIRQLAEKEDLVQILLSITRVAPKALTDPPVGGERQGYNFNRSREFIPVYKFNCGHWRSVAPKALTEAQQASGVQGFKLRADARFAQRSAAKLGVWV